MDARMDAAGSLGLPRALISRSALLHNAAVIRRALRPGTRLCAMVKADAYGHGAAIVADTLSHFSGKDAEAPVVDALAVATLDEAEALTGRLGTLSVPIHVLRPVEHVYIGRQRERIERAILAGHLLTVTHAAAASDVARIAEAMSRRASIQVMVDTGIAREGVEPAGLDELIASIQSRAPLKLHGLCTHFARAEEVDPLFTADQLRRFRQATERHVAVNPRLIRHAANSAALFNHPAAQLDLVRPGVALYGIDPSGAPNLDRHLRPVMKWTCPLMMIRTVKKGTAVGYGHTWSAPRDGRIGLVPVGYGDGYLRCLSNRGVVMVQDRSAPVIGRVSMDYMTVDLSDVPQANVGDEVVLMDSDPLSPASVYRLAGAADTIPYEIFTRVGPRVRRVAVEPVDAEIEETSSF